MKRVGWLSRPGTLTAAALLIGCSDASERPKGQIILALQSDMSVPKDVTHIRVKVKAGSDVRHEKDYEIEPGGTFLLPGTIAIVEGSRPSEVVTTEVIGIRRNGREVEARTFSKVVTTMPRERTVILRVPIQWLCDQTARALGDGDYVSSCAPRNGQETACRAGSCEPVEQDSELLPPYRASDVFGGGLNEDDPVGQCFDTVKCLDSGDDVEPTDECRIRWTGDRDRVNVGLRFDSEGPGICGEHADSSSCYVPLDRSEWFGWTFTDRDWIQLPASICTKQLEGWPFSIRVSDSCETKTERNPTCGPWSAVRGAEPIDVPNNAGSGGKSSPGVGLGGRGETEGGRANVGGTSGTTSAGGAISTAGVGGSTSLGGSTNIAGASGATSSGGGGGANTPSEETPECPSFVAEPGPVDDLEDGDNVIEPPYRGFWFSFNDGTGTQVPPSVDENDPYQPTPEGALGSSFAACTSGSDFTDWGAGIGFNLYEVGPKIPCAVDASNATGIRFYARGTGIVQLFLPTTASASPTNGGTCVSSTQCDWSASHEVPLSPDWTLHEVPFSSVLPGIFPLDSTVLKTIQFQAVSPSPDLPVPQFDFCVDEIEFY